MNASDVIRRVKRRFGDETGSIIEPQDILDWINDGQLDFVDKTDCLQALKSDFSHDTVTNADGNFALPADFLKIKRVTYRNNPLLETSLDKLDQVRVNITDQALPQYYYKFGNDLFLWPVPSQNFSGTPPNDFLKLYYTVVPETILGFTDELQIPVFMHEDLVQFCLIRAHERNENWQAANTLAGSLETRLAEDEQNSRHPYETYPVIRDDPHDWSF